MTKRIAGLTLAAALAAAPGAQAATSTPGLEVGNAITATFANLAYTPAKLVVATVGLVGGGIAGFLSGGDTRTAYSLWVPMTGGSYFLRPSHLDGSEEFHFWGQHYSDEASTASSENDGSYMYDALYD
jgi:hypothetical protein